MDTRLQELNELVQQAIAETLQWMEEQEKDEQKRRELEEFGAKLKAEIPDLQNEVTAERKKVAALTSRDKKLERELVFWQQKLDSYELQMKQLKSHYLGIPGADVGGGDHAASEAGSADTSILSDAIDLTHVLPIDVPETQCNMWTIESEPLTGHRMPFALPSMIPEQAAIGKLRSPTKKNARKRKMSIKTESDSDEAPKKRVTRTRILDADGVAVSRPVSGNTSR